MRRILAIFFVGLLWCNGKAYAENVYDYLASDTKKSYGSLYLYTNNKHASKKIKVSHVKIWFDTCSNSSNNPDRIYKVDRTVRPYEEIKYKLTDNFDHSGKYCRSVNAYFIKPVKYKYTPYVPPKKSGAQKLLDKIRGN
tara:strand:- start:509 stop:925 length:417 start_codon:yes stop_codon:yes gene_type:complete